MNKMAFDRSLLGSLKEKYENLPYRKRYKIGKERASLEFLKDKKVYVYGASEAAHWFYEIAFFKI